MEDTIAELRRQLEEARKAREEAEWRQKEERQAREEERRAREEAERRQGEAELRVQPNTLFRLLDRCHVSLSQAIRVETDATLTTQGDATDPVNRLYPKCIVPWLDFPRLQEQIWKKLDRTAAFTSRPLFPSDTQLDYVATNIQNKPIYSEASLRNFERDTVDNFVEMVIEKLRDDETLRHEFGIQGRVAFYDRANPAEPSLENSLEQMNLQDVRPQRPPNMRHRKSRGKGRGAAQSQKRAATARRRNRRADQFCVHVVANERQKPVYAVEFKAPHKVTIPEWVSGLHQMDLARDVIDQEGDTFEFYATCLVAAVVTQIFSYMIDSGIQHGYICTGEAFVFLHIPKDDPTIVQYFLCIPNQDVQVNDEWRLHRTAIGQVLAFTLQALAAEAPSQEWHDAAHDKLKTWEVEYLDVLRKIPETLRKDPPASNYRPSHWKLEPKTHNTRSRAHCQPGMSTPKHSSTEGSGSDEESHSPSIAAAARSRSSRGRGNNRQSTKESENTRAGGDNKQTSRKDGQSTRPYCTIACIRGMVNRDPLDKECPNWKLHGSQRHTMGPQEFTRRLHRQLARNRNHGFEQLHVCGRTGYLIKATLLLHGYTVIIKATTADKQHLIQAEADNYGYLRSLQGKHIPVCLGTFTPRVSYWYHGELMEQMMILSWSGSRLQHVINDDNSSFFHKEREKALAVLRSHGVVHGDSEWRNMLWDDLSGRLIVIDLEDVKWVKRPRALEPTSGNTRHGHRVGEGKSRQRLLSSSTAVCT
ncbi:uncharacterized protein N7446_005078 [Penicillium canescens]|uniref:Protein kinase domain-containing protein n=1 Tax=Penicillium canescens TaxID=5083 RepID=A0AAD6N7G9_PENCN|nr:uncharacterized protein N7446_005078 [Penicillium canescens]KAJ6038268.1 hypothetical protein N7460_008039 [Penicillium canescens]KAJ6039612.1 hypothetical protein N7444_008517 [Penicillium canescens]KAJ6068041.1 hypothetical protein N7446_005078 [Penicillium canescens]KAJ6181483.1 hypothetical protein N7485_000125 [Penicillium canescens]